MAARSTGRGGELTKERIVDEAIALLDEEGVAALSMRRLASRLGTSTMSTYHHLDDKDALIDAIADRLISQLTIPMIGARWDDAVRTVAWSFRELTMAHPAAFRLMLGTASPPALVRAADRLVAVLDAGGLGPDRAVACFAACSRYLVGSTLADADPFETGSRSPARRALDSEQFRFGLDALIAGIAVITDPISR